MSKKLPVTLPSSVQSLFAFTLEVKVNILHHIIECEVSHFWSCGGSASDSWGAPACPAAGHPPSGSGTVLRGGCGCCFLRRCSSPGRCCSCCLRPWTPTSSRGSLEASLPPLSHPRARNPGYPDSRPAWTEGTGCLRLLRAPRLGAGCSPSRCPRQRPICAAAAEVWPWRNSWCTYSSFVGVVVSLQTIEHPVLFKNSEKSHWHDVSNLLLFPTVTFHSLVNCFGKRIFTYDAKTQKLRLKAILSNGLTLLAERKPKYLQSRADDERLSESRKILLSSQDSHLVLEVFPKKKITFSSGLDSNYTGNHGVECRMEKSSFLLSEM